MIRKYMNLQTFFNPENWLIGLVNFWSNYPDKCCLDKSFHLLKMAPVIYIERLVKIGALTAEI